VLDPLPAQVLARQRQRRSRARRKAGVALLRIEVDELHLIEALIACGRLATADGLQRSRVEQEVSKLVEDWVARWRKAVTRGLASSEL
jgi:hypothetical protein